LVATGLSAALVLQKAGMLPARGWERANLS
jgi:hypothetical protein